MTVTRREKRFVIEYDDVTRNEIKQLIGDTKVTLASGSPRRHEILKHVGLTPEVVVPQVSEDISRPLPWGEFALAVARKKLDSIPAANGITLSADTIVVLDGNILGKPADNGDAVRILQILSGKRHCVITAVVMRNDSSGIVAGGFDKSFVTFHSLSRQEILDYIASGEPMDKAGAYGIQGMGELLVERLEGPLDNVIGFPVGLFVRLLKELS